VWLYNIAEEVIGRAEEVISRAEEVTGNKK
jgi:hypothetical protein